MIKGGYVLKPRIISKSEIANKPPCVRETWDYLIREANHKLYKSRGFEIKRGQLFRSYQQIRDDLSWNKGFVKKRYSENQMKQAFRYLRDTNRITTQKKPGGVLISICNYSRYQNPSNYEKTQEKTSEKTFHKYKKGNNDKKSIPLDSESNEQPDKWKDENPLHSRKLSDISMDEVVSTSDSTIPEKIDDMAWRMYQGLGEDFSNYPYYKKATLKKWRTPIRLMRSEDGIPLSDIWSYFKFCRQHDKFWRSTIQSPSGLRNNINKIMSDFDNRKDSTTKIYSYQEMLDLVDNPSHPSKTTDDFDTIKENGKTRFKYAG